MKLRKREKVELVGRSCVKDREIGRGILRTLSIVDIATANRILGANRVVNAGCQSIEVLECWTAKQVVAKRNVRRSTCWTGDGEGLQTGCLVEASIVSDIVNLSTAEVICCGNVLCILLEVVGAETIRGRVAIENRETCCGRCAAEAANALADGIALVVRKEEKLVAEDRASKLAAITIVVVTRVWNLAAGNTTGRVQVAILKVLVAATVKMIGSGKGCGVELSAR